MYKKIFKLSLFILAISSRGAFAVATADQLDKQERDLVRKTAQLQVINLNYSKYRALFDGPFNGPQGLISQVEDFNKSTLDLVTRWDALLQLSTFTQQLNGVKQIDLINKIKTLLSDRRNDLELLREKNDSIRATVMKIRSTLSLIDPVAESNFTADGFGPYIAAYNKNLVDMPKTLDKINSYANDRVNDISGYTNRSEKTIVENLRQLLISRGVADTQSVVTQAQNVLRVDNIGGRRLSAAKALFKKVTLFDNYYLSSHAAAALVLLEKEVSTARTELQNPANTGPIATDYIKALEQVYREASDRVKLLQGNSATDNALFAQLLLPDYFKSFCDSKNPRYNCSMLNSLTKLSETQLKAMTSDQLKKVEFLWDQVGPIALAQ